MSAWLRSVTGRAHQPSLTTPTAKAGAPKRVVRWRALARAHRELRLGKPSNTSGLSEDRRAETDTAQAALLIGVYSYYYLSKSSRPAQIWARHFLPQRHEERKDGSKGIPPLRSSCSLRSLFPVTLVSSCSIPFVQFVEFVGVITPFSPF